MMSDEEFKSMNDEEFAEYVKFIEDDFPRHYQNIKDIKVETVLTPEEVIKIAKEFHKKMNSAGTVNEDIEKLLFYDEEYTFEINREDRNKDIVKPAWRVQVDLPPSPFEAYDYTLIVSDPDKKVMDKLGPSGHPVPLEPQEWTDEDIEYFMSEEDDEDMDEDMWGFK